MVNVIACYSAVKVGQNYIKGKTLAIIVEQVEVIAGNPDISGVAFVGMRSGRTVAVFTDSELFIKSFNAIADKMNGSPLRSEHRPSMVNDSSAESDAKP